MSAGEALAKALAKAIGGNDEQKGVDVFLDTGYAPLNHAISGKFKDGGLPAGRIVELFGPSSSGKTAVATKAMIAAQRAGGIAGFQDHERSFHMGLAQRLGLDVDSPTFVYKKPVTFEQSVTQAIKAAQTIREGKFIDEKAPIIWVFDSLAGMVPQSKMAKDVDEYNMNDTTALARATSSICPALAQHCEAYNMLALFLNQIRMKPGVTYGDPTTTPGGEAPKYWSSVRIQLGASRLMDGEGEEKRMIGQKVTARCIKNKVHRPFQTATWNFRFRDDGSGYFDIWTGMIDYLVGLNRLEVASAGRMVVWEGKAQFKKLLAAQLSDDPSGYDKLCALLPSDEEAAKLPVEATTASE